MARLILRKTLNGRLEPTDDLARDALAKIAAGDLVAVEIKKARNVQLLRKFYALMSLVFQNQERYASLDELVDVVKVYVGHCEITVASSGEKVYRPKSISFARAEEIEFQAFYERVVKLVLERFLPHVTEEQLARELEEFST